MESSLRGHAIAYQQQQRQRGDYQEHPRSGYQQYQQAQPPLHFQNQHQYQSHQNSALFPPHGNHQQYPPSRYDQNHGHDQQRYSQQQQHQHQQQYSSHHQQFRQSQQGYVPSGGGSVMSHNSAQSRGSHQQSLSNSHQFHQQPHHQQSQHHQHFSDHGSVGGNQSHYSRGSHGSSKQSSVVDMAYRRLGHRLSRRAHGDDPVPRPVALSTLGSSRGSGFSPYGRKRIRSPKHQNDPNSNVLKKMTVNASELFQKWQKDAPKTLKGRKKKPSSSSSSQKKRSSSNSKQPTQQQQPPDEIEKPRSDSPPHQAFSRIAIDTRPHDDPRPTNRESNNMFSLDSGQLGHHHHHHHHQSMQKKQGLLSAVMESSSQASSRTQSIATKEDSSSYRSLRSKESRSSSIATKSTAGTKSALPQGKCLTVPSEPVSNDGLDNAESNLILHENDTISISRKQIHVLQKDQVKNWPRFELRVQSLLGQGTFAQVFQCLHLHNGQTLAVKVIKNKPAYTRQAAVEIDIFRALITDAPSSSSRSTGSSSSHSSSKNDHMVNLVCYFMYKSHLCLVFEVLGLNLYEVLKKRQFRGLPLPIVKNLIRQAVSSVREVSRKNVIHCDLKPENILLVNEDDAASIVSVEHRKSPSSEPKSNLTSSMEQRKKTKPSGLSRALEGSLESSATSTTQAAESASHSISSVATSSAPSFAADQKIKLIDFGSACFEGQTAHTYIQSRFYRSPEVLMGLPYDSAIDMWSLGCIAAELYLGLPILPGVHEHDQLGRICEMIARPPDWILDQGAKAKKFFVKFMPQTPTPPPAMATDEHSHGHAARLPQWRIKTQREYISSLSQSEIHKKGGLAKLDKQPTNRYFKRKRLFDIIMLHSKNGNKEERELAPKFAHFLYGILDPDPWKRWTAQQVLQHPFLTDRVMERRGSEFDADTKDANIANLVSDLFWEPQLDPGIYRRKLQSVQKMREKQHSTRRRMYSGSRSHAKSSSGSDDGASVGNNSVASYEYNDHGNISPSSIAAATHRSLDHASNEYPYQAPPSIAEYYNGGADDASASGIHPNGGYLMTAPQSFTDHSYQGHGVMLEEPDFGYALQRPGVIPMGESVSSFSDAGSAQFQQAFSLSHYYGHTIVGSPDDGRSYGEMSTNSRARALQQEQVMPAQPTAQNQHRPQQQPQSNHHLQSQSKAVPGPQMNLTIPSDFSNIQQIQQQQQPAPMGFDAQAYFQQQHAVLQQQQALLQQQQATLALQAERLRSMGNPVDAGMMTNGTAPAFGGIKNAMNSIEMSGNRGANVQIGNQISGTAGLNVNSQMGIGPTGALGMMDGGMNNTSYYDNGMAGNGVYTPHQMNQHQPMYPPHQPYPPVQAMPDYNIIGQQHMDGNRSNRM